MSHDGKQIEAAGFITQLKFIVGRDLQALEGILGFASGRLAKGASLGCLLKIPKPDEFDLYGYSQVAAHRTDTRRKAQGEVYWKGLDPTKLKQLVSNDVFALKGPNMLVKVFPVTPHNELEPDEGQYPPGAGAPQWKLLVKLPFIMVSQSDQYPGGRLGENL